jgi:hypothetical protein
MTTTYAVGQRLTATVLQSLADYTINRPIVRLIATATQNLTNNTSTAITFGASSTIIDTHSYHSESSNTSRVTPLIAGYYRAMGVVAHGGSASYTTLQSVIKFNGVDQAGNQRQGPNATNSQRGVPAEGVFLCNGSTDYLELAGLQASGGTVATVASGSTTSYFEVEFVRPA